MLRTRYIYNSRISIDEAVLETKEIKGGVRQLSRPGLRGQVERISASDTIVTHAMGILCRINSKLIKFYFNDNDKFISWINIDFS